MTYCIDRAALDDFLARQVELVEAIQIPGDLGAEIARSRASEGLTVDELHAVWLAAGLTALIGVAIAEQPERFLTQVPRSVPAARSPRRRPPRFGAHSLQSAPPARNADSATAAVRWAQAG